MFSLSLKTLFLYFTLLVIFFISFFLILFFLDTPIPLAPASESVSFSEDNTYELKNLKIKSYGFLPFWSVNKFVPKYDALTDISYFSLYLNADGSIKKLTKEGNLEPGYNNLKNNQKLKKILEEAKKEGVRTSLTISLHVNEDIEDFLKCQSCWAESYKETKKIIQQYGFTGLNYDFEYLGNAPLELTSAYTNYIDYVSKKFKSSNSDFQIVVSAFADSAKEHRLTDISGLQTTKADYIFIMAYDFFVPTSSTSGPLAPVSGAPERYKYDLTLMFKDYLSKIDSSRLILGLAFYGHNWVVQNHSPLAQRISGNSYLGYSISQNYYAIKKKIKEDNLTIGWDAIAQAPFINYYKGYVARKIYFENPKSISKKIELAKENNLAGVGIWALGYDGKETDLIDLFKDYLNNGK